MFWIVSALFLVIAALFIAVPLWLRLRSSADDSEELRKQANIALFQERSDELEADLSAGNIDQQQFDSLLLEMQQNLLADVGVADKAGSRQSTPDSSNKLTWMLPSALVLLIPLVAYSLYQTWGYFDDVQAMDLFEATVNNQGDTEEATRLLLSIIEIAEDNPDMPWAPYFIGQNLMNLGMFNEAEAAFQRAADLLDPGAEKALVLGRVAMAMYINANFQITDEIAAVIDEARELNPGEIAVLQLLATDAEQRQDYQAAIDYWRLMIQASPNSQMAQELRVRISEAQNLLAASGEIEAGPVIQVNLSLADELDLDPGLRVFIAARNAEREGMPPLAAVDTTVGALPASIRLDNGSAVGPFNLSSSESVYVSALVSNAGVATPRSGDYRVVSEVFAHNNETSTIELVIADPVP